MAVRLREGRTRSPYQVYWNNPFTNKRESQSFATEEEALKFDYMVKYRLRFEKESFTPEMEPPEIKNQEFTFEMLYLEYLKAKKFDKRGLITQKYCTKLALQNLGQSLVSEITKDQLTKLRDTMLRSNLKPVTVRKRMSVLRTVIRWGIENGFCTTMPIFPTMPQGHYQKFVPPSSEELEAILNVAPQHIVRVVILGAQLGVRVGPCELLQLKWSDVDFAKNVLRVQGSHKNPNAPWREVPIRESLRQKFLQWKNEDLVNGMEYIIHFRGKPVQSIKTSWRTTLKNAGIQRKIRPYDLRHAFGTEAVAAGTDIGTVANLMGHSTPAMLLKHYQYVMDKQKRAAVELLPDLSHVPTFMCPEKKTSQVQL